LAFFSSACFFTLSLALTNVLLDRLAGFGDTSPQPVQVVHSWFSHVLGGGRENCGKVFLDVVERLVEVDLLMTSTTALDEVRQMKSISDAHRLVDTVLERDVNGLLNPTIVVPTDLLGQLLPRDDVEVVRVGAKLVFGIKLFRLALVTIRVASLTVGQISSVGTVDWRWLLLWLLGLHLIDYNFQCGVASNEALI
jgi:hypothetical protein